MEAGTRVQGGSTLEGTYAVGNSDPTAVQAGTEGLHGFGARFVLDAGTALEGEPGSRDRLAANADVTLMEINFGRWSGQELPPGFDLFSGATRGVYVDDSSFAAIMSWVFRGSDNTRRALIYVNGELVEGELVEDARWGGRSRALDGLQRCRAGDRPVARRSGLLRLPVRPLRLVGRADRSRRRRRGGRAPTSCSPAPSSSATCPRSAISRARARHSTRATRRPRSAARALPTPRWAASSRTGTSPSAPAACASATSTGAATMAPSARRWPTPRDFAGSLAQVAGAGAASGDLVGSFFSDGTDPAVDVGGRFTITEGSTYSAVGSFAATSR